MLTWNLKAWVAVAGTAWALVACSDSGGTNDVAGNVAGVTSGTVGGATTGATGTTGTSGGTTTMGSGVTSATSAGTTATTGTTTTTTGSTTGVGAGGMSTTGMGGTTSGATVGGMGGAGMGGASMGGMGGTSASGMGGTGMAAGGTANTGEDIDMTADDFSCIADWDRVSGFRITNLLGHLDEALAVANSATGGVYPVGTVIQHLPTEAMVKRATGFSPETRDWEFFLLELSSDGMTTIAERGTTEIQTSMGQTCVSCHSMPPEQWDFVCNTWADSGGGDCGFDFMDDFLDQQLATDTRCN